MSNPKKEYYAARYLRLKEEIKKRAREYYRLNREIILQKMRVYQEGRKKEIAAYHRAYYSANREKYAAQRKNWQRINPSKASAHARMRQARKLKAMPKWADPIAIQRFYDVAAMLTKSTGIEWTVDHIYPLTNDKVCGLHTEANLQLLTRVENSRKGNNHPDE